MKNNNDLGTPSKIGDSRNRFPVHSFSLWTDPKGQDAFEFLCFLGTYWHFSILIVHNIKVGASTPTVSEYGTRPIVSEMESSSVCRCYRSIGLFCSIFGAHEPLTTPGQTLT